ncbi:Chitin synthase, class 5 [Cryptotrichosporon argae]
MASTTTRVTPSRSHEEQYTFTLGKLDAGMAILLGPNAHLLEFPSLLLPAPSPDDPPLGPGSILTITVSRDLSAEQAAQGAFSALQTSIMDAYGTTAPSAPALQLRNVTQTSVCVEWDRLALGNAGFRALELYKNGQRWGRVGGDVGGKAEKREWKTGGLQSGDEYTFQLVLKTTAGTFPSNLIRVRTHTMDNLTGLYIAFGPVTPPSLLDQLRTALSDIGARESRGIFLDTTHYVASSALDEETGTVDGGYADAAKVNLPVVSPGWLMAVATEKKLVPISSFILPAPPSQAPVSSEPVPPFRRPSPLKRSSLPLMMGSPSSPAREHAEDIARSPSPETIARMSMTGAVASIAGSGSGSGSSSRPPSLERRASRDATLPSVPESDRPRAAKPEADGKLDRAFRFPLKADASPSAYSPTSTVGNTIDSPVANASDPLAANAVGSPVVAPAVPPVTATVDSSVSPVARITQGLERTTLNGEARPVVVAEPEDTAREAGAQAEEAPVTDDLPAKSASTIDEAIAIFSAAVHTPVERAEAVLALDGEGEGGAAIEDVETAPIPKIEGEPTEQEEEAATKEVGAEVLNEVGVSGDGEATGEAVDAADRQVEEGQTLDEVDLS